MNNFTPKVRGTNTLSHFNIKNAVVIMGLTLLADITLAGGVPVIVESNETTLSSEWTGLYGGLNIGGIFNNADLEAHQLGFTDPDEACDKSANFSSFFPGLQLGYAYQFDTQIVLGVEGDFTYNVNHSDDVACVCDFNPRVSDQFSIKNKLQGSLRGRIGYALDNHLLPFFTAGGSLADLGLSYHNEDGDHYSKNTTQGGWLVGAGLEWGPSPDWSLRAEYYYTSYGSNAMDMKIPTIYGLFDANGEAHVKLNANNVRVAVNYWF